MVAQELHQLIKGDIARMVREAMAEVRDRIIDVKEAAALLGIKPKTVYNNIDKIPHFKVGRFLRFNEREIYDYSLRRPSF